MDQTQLQQNIAKYYAKLPSDLQQSFSSMTWMEDLKNISTKYFLNNEQIEILATETTLVLLSIIHVEEYKNTIERDLNLPKEIFDKIFEDINNIILKNISTKLEEAFSLNVDSLLEEKYGGDKKLDKRFESLPKEVQFAINESNYQITLYSIAEKYQLNIEQMGMLEEITTKVMLGIIHPDNYESELSNKIIIKKDDISNLIKDVNEQILKTIRESLKKHWDDNQQTEDGQIPLPPYAKTIISGNKIEPVVKPTDISKNIFEDKLNTPTVSNQTVSDYSIPKTNKIPLTSETKPRSSDPYREEF